MAGAYGCHPEFPRLYALGVVMGLEPTHVLLGSTKLLPKTASLLPRLYTSKNSNIKISMGKPT